MFGKLAERFRQLLSPALVVLDVDESFDPFVAHLYLDQSVHHFLLLNDVAEGMMSCARSRQP